MNRTGCPEEDTRQSVDGPGLVRNDEPIVYALIRPRTNTVDQLVTFPSGNWSKRELSVCRAAYSSFAEFYDNVVVGQTSKQGFTYEGYVWAFCSDIRAIEVETRDGKATGVGGICVIDHPLVGFEAHAHMGECRPNPKFWEKNNRQAVKLNLGLLFESNGVQQVLGYPFSH